MMKSFFKKLAFVMALAMVVTMAAPAAAKAYAADMYLAYQTGGKVTELNMKVGSEEDLCFKKAPTNWASLTKKWSSDNEAVAIVDKNGVVTAIADGVAVITFTLGDGTAASATVNVGEIKPYDVTLGNKDDKAMKALELKVGTAFDLNFYGVKDWAASKYSVTWISNAPEVAKVDQKGNVAAVAAGTATVTAAIVNNKTGVVMNVAPVIVTVPAEVVVPEISVTAKQTTVDDVVLTFTGVDASKLVKEDIEVYEYYTNEYGTEFEYIWQLKSIWYDEEKDTLTITGYETAELQDEATYVVRYVDRSEEDTKVIAETSFVASVGEVDTVNAYYASYFHNNNWWQFYNHAYTNEGSGEEIEIKVFADLYDDEGINVTKHYERLAGTDDLVTLELVTEDAEPYVTWDETTNEVIFTEIPESPAVKFTVIYDDFENGDTVTAELPMVVEKAPDYQITSIDKWTITLNDDAHASKKYQKDSVALYDDYDLVTGTELMNHEIVLWFTDNYGNKYVTNERFAEWPYSFIETSEKFTGEGYEIRYEARNPQVLVVGDDLTGSEIVNSSVITTKKVGTGTINVTLYNVYEEVLCSRLGIIRVAVNPQRYIKTVSADSVSVTTDSKPAPAETARYNRTDEFDGDGDYDSRFTTRGGDVYLTIKDQYGDAWGLYNQSARDLGLDIKAETTNVEIDELVKDDWSRQSNLSYKKTFDGAALLGEIGEKVSSVSYKVTVTDLINDAEKATTFRVSLKYPSENNDGELLCKTAVKLSASNITYTTKKLYKEIRVEEISNNGYAVNYVDNITLLDSKDDYNKLFGASADRETATTSGAYYIAVFDPKGNVVGFGDSTELGVEEVESGLYNFWVADTEDGNACTKFATTGTYTVKLMKVTTTKGSGATGLVNTFTTTTTRFTVTDDRYDIVLKNQDLIYVDRDFMNDKGIDDLCGIAQKAFTYNYKFEQWNNGVIEVAGVRYRENTKSSQVVIKDVFIKVNLNKNGDSNYYDGVYYYVEVPVNKTITLEDLSLINGVESVPVGKNPEGNKMQ